MENNKGMKKIYSYILFVLSILSGLTIDANTHAAYGKSNDDFGYTLKPDESGISQHQVGSTTINFDISPTGAATFNIPLTVAKGHNGMQPNISITYNSQSDNGVVGYGCSITGLSVISLVPGDIYHDGKATGLKWDGTDKFSIDGQRLMLISGEQGQEGSTYRMEFDPMSEITIKKGNQGLYFHIATADGRIITYGNTYASRLNKWEAEKRCVSWFADHEEDALGNFIDYEYMQNDDMVYLSRIIYGKNKNITSIQIPNVVDFVYESRPDAQKRFIGDMTVSMGLRLASVTAKKFSNVLRKYIFDYDDSSDLTATKFSRLTSVIEENGNGEQLKPLKINWKPLPSHSQSTNYPDVTLLENSQVHKGQQNFMSADLNGDGISDLIEMCPVVIGADQYNGDGDNHCYVYPSMVNEDGSISFSHGLEFPLGPSIMFDDWTDLQGSPIATDITGDGISELIIPNMTVIDDTGMKRATFQFICGNKSGGKREMNSFICAMKKSKEFPLYTAADFDNDGKSEIIVVEREPVSGSTYNLIRIYNTSGYSLSHTETSIGLAENPKRLFSADFDNDGLNDIIFLYESGYKIYFNTGEDNRFDYRHSMTATGLENRMRVEPGDFNGDGAIDFITYEADVFDLYLGEGTGRFKHVSIGKLSDISGHNEEDDKFSMIVLDFDHDGKSDIVIPTLQGKAKVYWLRSTGNNFEIVKTAISNREDDVRASNFTIGDFNGDGIIELMNYGFNSQGSSVSDEKPVFRYYSNSTVTDGKIAQVTDGYDNRTIFIYGSLANNKDLYTADDRSTYPVIDIIPPLHVVSKMISGNGASPDETMEFKYSGLKAHAQGRGLLGMTSITMENKEIGLTRNNHIARWDNNVFIPVVTTRTETMGGSTATTTTTKKIADKGKKTYFIYTEKEISTDFDGYISVSEYAYDTDICSPTKEKTSYDGGLAYRVTKYDNYVRKGGSWLPQTVSETVKYSDDAEEETTVTKTAYNDNGLKSSMTENYGSSLPLTTEYKYDIWGNLLYRTYKESNTGNYYYYYVYDKYGYDIIEKRNKYKLVLKPQPQNLELPDVRPIKLEADVETFTYDPLGNMLTESDETVKDNILTTKHVYDSWGNRTKTISPEGIVSKSTMGWGTSQSKKYYVLEQAQGQPWVKTWYDSKGREILVESVGPMDINVSKETEYNKYGKPARKISKTGVIAVIETFEYDGRGRMVVCDNNKGDKKTITYGKREQTITDGKGRATTKVYDTWGNTVSSASCGTTVEYEYNSFGKPASVKTCDTETVIGYDDVGNRASLSCPDAGTSTFVYDVLGREIERTDARGKTTTTCYDGLGRVYSVTSDGVETSYTYGENGFSALRLVKVQTEGNSATYTHDKYGRVIQERRVVNGTALDFSYTYDNNGALARIVYPGNTAVDYTYDSYGNRVAIIVGNDTVWKLKKHTGRVTYHALGGNLTSKEIRDARTGRVSQLSVYKGVDNLFHMAFVHDMITGNLMSRSNMFPMVKESFSYDDFDRLLGVKTQVSLNIPPAYDDDGNDFYQPEIQDTLPVIYPPARPQGDFESFLTFPSPCDCTYSPGGNITSKAGIGLYTYDCGKPHAVSMVDNEKGIIPIRNQYAEYDGDGKIKQLSDGFQVMDFSYGPDGERWQTTLTLNGKTLRSTLYAGDYERISVNDTIREFYYLGNEVLYVKETGKADRILYLITDNLGSVVNIIDNNGNKVFEAYYDAWGRQTLKQNDIGYNRGYTGHEMMTEFGLINMNGRLYDPLLGRFLSPDNYVQLPDNSQSYNRYSYCLNNPLKYTDPSGELFGIDDLVIGTVGGFANLISNLAAGNVRGFWHGVSLFGNGALAGIAALYAGPMTGAFILGTGNSIINQGFTKGWGNVNLGDVFISGVTSSAIGYLGQGLSTYLSGTVSSLTSGVSNNILRNALNGAVSNSISGFGFGTLLSLGQGHNLSESLQQGLNSAAHGAVIGTIAGVGNGFIENRQNAQISKIENNAFEPERVVKEVMSSEKTPLGFGTNSVYSGKDIDGAIRYVGITKRPPEVRFNEHLKSGTNRATLHFEVIKGTGTLSRIQAKIIEQQIINILGKGKYGGMLYNERNSISPKYWNIYGLMNN